ncbi:hypothetical protein WA026_019625 [Henosepilachna vigintioctopunctata]|uniref:Uncharacterized protein n=1 Tax=Henosepilachna vigintioctopunctata TaxID=420089 RepID=A0AAW1TWP7_9CUCU
MKYLGFDVTALKWFNSYLSNRKLVKVDESVSELSHVESCSNHDLQICMSCQPSNLQQTIEVINSELENLTLWCAKNALKLNPGKSKAQLLRGEAHACTIDM